MRLLVTAAALWLFGVTSALAQSADWLVLPTSTDDQTAWMQPTVSKVARELRMQGLGVWSSRRAVARLEARGSAPPAVATDAEIAAWAAQSGAAVRMLASGDYQTALDELEQAQAFSRKALETLNREAARAQTVLDTCLYLVRALTDTGDEQRAATQAQECARMVPFGAPTPYMHPPQVTELYEAAAQSGPAHKSTVLVESDPSGCRLRINGIVVGETPFEVGDLYPGRYRVQVECEEGRSGRVHLVDAPAGNTSLFIFDHFDRAVRSMPVLHLRYDEPPAAQLLARDVREIARALPASAIVVASISEVDTLDLRLIAGGQMGSALARIPTTAAGPSTAAVASATTALLARECKDFRGDAPVPIDCTTGRPTGALALAEAVEPLRRPHGQFVWGVSLASVGTASLLTGYALLITRKPAGDNWISDPASLNDQDKWVGLGKGLVATGAIGSGLLVAAMPLALPYKAKTPWWAWLSGGLGVAAAAGAVASGVTADPKPTGSCSVNEADATRATECVDRGRRIDLAVLLGVTAAPLLTMPLVYLLRKDEKKLDASLTPSVQASRHGASVGLRGVF